MAWLASLAVLTNLFVVSFSQALTTQEHALLLLGGFCSTLSDSLPCLKLSVVFKDIDLPDDHESLAPHLCCCAGAADTPGLVASWLASPLAPLASPARNAFSTTDLSPLRYWRLANPHASPVTWLLPCAFDSLDLRVGAGRGAMSQLLPRNHQSDGKRPVTRCWRITTRISLFAAAALLAVSVFTRAHEYSAGQLHIEHPWALALPPTSPNGVAYFVVQNHGKESDTLLGADAPRAVSAEVYEHVHKNSMMNMQKVDSVDAASGKDLRFAFGDYHLMLMGPKQPLVTGGRFPLTLYLRKAGDVPVEIVVEPKASAEQGGYEQHGH